MDPNRIIDALGGTTEVARLCEVASPSVSQWRGRGIPRARLMFLRLARPEVFATLDPHTGLVGDAEAANAVEPRKVA